MDIVIRRDGQSESMVFSNIDDLKSSDGFYVCVKMHYDGRAKRK